MAVAIMTIYCGKCGKQQEDCDGCRIYRSLAEIRYRCHRLVTSKAAPLSPSHSRQCFSWLSRTRSRCITWVFRTCFPKILLRRLAVPMFQAKRRHSPKPSGTRERVCEFRRRPLGAERLIEQRLTGIYKDHPAGDIRCARRYRQTLAILLLSAVVLYFYLSHDTKTSSPYRAAPKLFAKRIQKIDTRPDPHDDLDDDHRRFLAYYPHGGFHSQRLALENALTLSRILDRTLLLPPLWIGRQPRWWSGQSLRYSLANVSKPALTHCRDPTQTEPRDDCEGYSDWTQVSWNWLVDLDMTDVEWVDRWDFRDDWLHREVDDDGLGLAKDEVYRIMGDEPFDTQITENADAAEHPYSTHLSIVALSDLPHRLIHFDSLTGGNRLALESTHLLGIKHEVQTSMVISNPLILDTTSKITRLLGPGYVSIDARLHGPLEAEAGLHMRASWWELGRRLGIEDNVLRQAEIDVWRRSPGWRKSVTGDPDGRYPPPPARIGDRFVEESRAERRPGPSTPVTPANIACPRLKHSRTSLLPFNTPLFLTASTDDTRSHPALRLFYSTYPCLFTLNTPEIAKIVDREIGQNSVNEMDGYVLSSWLREWVGLETAARGNELVGTNGSAWGKWAEQMVQPIARK